MTTRRAASARGGLERTAETLNPPGATREGLLERLVFGSIPESVGRGAESTVTMAKRNLGITSRLRNPW